MSGERRFSWLIGRSHLQLAVEAFAIYLGPSASPQNNAPVIYPSRGQTQEQQDKYECSQWAVSESGFNPGNPAPPTSRKVQQGQAVRGAARGAAAGAIGGAIAGDAGTCAAAGAAIGGEPAQSAAAQRRRRSNNRRKPRRPLPAARMHTIERLRRACRDAAIQSTEADDVASIRACAPSWTGFMDRRRRFEQPHAL